MTGRRNNLRMLRCRRGRPRDGGGAQSSRARTFRAATRSRRPILLPCSGLEGHVSQYERRPQRRRRVCRRQRARAFYPVEGRMKKIRLDLDELAVDSFDIDAAEAHGGTVEGQVTTW